MNTIKKGTKMNQIIKQDVHKLKSYVTDYELYKNGMLYNHENIFSRIFKKNQLRPYEKNYTTEIDRVLSSYNKEDLKLYIDLSIDMLLNLKEYSHLHIDQASHIAIKIYQVKKDKALFKDIIRKMIPYTNIYKTYGIARICFNLTKDFEFTVEVYQKAIDKCYEINNTSRLHLLGQSMYLPDDKDYFRTWGEKIKAEAKRISDMQKIDKSYTMMMADKIILPLEI